LNKQLRTRIYWVVQSLKKILALVLVAVWSLAANHCKLEQLSGFQFLKCSESAAAASHPEDNCDQDGCASAESSFYKTENRKLTATAPLSAQTALALILPAAGRLAVEKNHASGTAPPELPKCWQFVFRTASPPRAPSSVS
jgi:hypothetical protein